MKVETHHVFQLPPPEKARANAVYLLANHENDLIEYHVVKNDKSGYRHLPTLSDFDPEPQWQGSNLLSIYEASKL